MQSVSKENAMSNFEKFYSTIVFEDLNLKNIGGCYANGKMTQ